MPQNSFDRAIPRSFARDQSILKNVYTWMALGLAITGVVALYVASTPALMQTLVGNRMLFFLLIAGELGLVFFLSARIHKMSPGAATASFAGYAILNGVTLSVIFLAYTNASIARAFFVAAGMFAGMSLWAMTTKKDLSSIGNYLIMGLWGIIIASLVNIFLASSSLSWVISFVGVFLFLGLTAYDTQIIKRWSAEMGDVDDADYMRISIMGALKLYLDFINLFLFLLRLLGNRE
ncbi:MAG: Bax inhibitor-1/YccA family protein, partial [Alkalispirochaetaceae bacterium]